MGWFDSLFGDTDWGSVIASGASAMMSGRDQRNQSKNDWKKQLEAMRLNFLQERELGAQQRQWELEDRKYKGDAIGNYAQFYTGPEVQRPGPIDTTVTLRDLPPELGGKSPEAEKPKKRKKKKGGFFRKLFG